MHAAAVVTSDRSAWMPAVPKWCTQSGFIVMNVLPIQQQHRIAAYHFGYVTYVAKARAPLNAVTHTCSSQCSARIATRGNHKAISRNCDAGCAGINAHDHAIASNYFE